MRGDSAYKILDDGRVAHNGKTYRLYSGPLLEGPRNTIDFHDRCFPPQLRTIPDPPATIYVIGDPDCLENGLAIIGARKATPYGLSCAQHFAELAALKGICIVSGGALGCDSKAHQGALDAGGRTVVFLGGGCDQIYPATNYRLFQDVIDSGGAVVSENPWGHPALPYTFRRRNRLIAGCSKAVLIVEAGLPSGTFSTADEALSAGREVLSVPGAITSVTSAGSNRLLYQGATPIVDDESFEDALFLLFGSLRTQNANASQEDTGDPLLAAIRAEPLRLDDIVEKVSVPKRLGDPYRWITRHLVELEATGDVARFPDGRYGPAHL